MVARYDVEDFELGVKLIDIELIKSKKSLNSSNRFYNNLVSPL
jgi:hypothetical protein